MLSLGMFFVSLKKGTRMKKFKVQIVITVGIMLNVVGAYIAMSLSIPFYMDSIGTLLAALLLGPKYAMITGVLGSLTSGVLFDMYSFYYAPTQLLTGFFAGILYHAHWLKGKRMPLGIIMIGLPTSLASAMITAGLFGGITSSSSGIFALLLNKAGLHLVVSVLLVQVITDCTDKAIAYFIAKLVIEKGKLKEKWGIKWNATAK